MRKSSFFLCSLAVEVVVLGLLLTHASFHREAMREGIEEKAAMVRSLGLTDLCLFTDARYTRNLSQADLFSAFQDNPLSLDHFPSGSFTTPPIWIMRRR